MNNLSPLGLLTCFIFSMALNGASFSSAEPATSGAAYVVNHSKKTIYYKPESRDANPGLEPDAAYAIPPGESLFAPVDAIITPDTEAGKIFRVPTGARLVIDEKGTPRPFNLIARGGLLLPAYGYVNPPSPNFAKLANSKQVLYRTPDILARRF